MSNSKHVLFNRAQQNFTGYANATNWNGTGYDQIYNPPSKCVVKISTNILIICNVKVFYMKIRYCGDNETF
jgi:hypothetical protein